VARTFDGSVDTLTHADATQLDPPFPMTIGLWYRSATGPGTFRYLVSKVHRAGDHPSYALQTNASGEIRFLIGWGTNPNEFSFTNGIGTAFTYDGRWHHIAGTYDGVSMKLWFDGSLVDTVAEVRPIGYNPTLPLWVGSFDGSIGPLFASGDYAELSLWTAALTVDELVALGHGVSPQLIRPSALGPSWPLTGRSSPEVERRYGLDLTVVGATTYADGPPILRPAGAKTGIPSAAAPNVDLALAATAGPAAAQLTLTREVQLAAAAGAGPAAGTLALTRDVQLAAAAGAGPVSGTLALTRDVQLGLAGNVGPVSGTLLFEGETVITAMAATVGPLDARMELSVTGPVTQVPIQTGPCAWPLQPDCCSDWTATPAKFPDAVKLYARTMAAKLMWALSGRRYGLCEITVRPCRKAMCSGAPTNGWWSAEQPWFPMINRRGVWVNSCGCAGGSDCGCGSEEIVWLPGPVQSIAEVLVDGVVIDPSAYRVWDWHKLQRTDGGMWPACQDFDADPNEVGSFVVTYQRGIEPPDEVGCLTGVLACEIAKMCVSDKSCRLPRNVTNVSRQGVSMDFPTLESVLKAKRTGIPEVDMWLAVENPDGLANDSVVWSPDRARARRRTS
jgi:hypothetical protein